jgi:catechol 2,3-dioxygenase-like lactoylglutathione lyase family enzyme
MTWTAGARDGRSGAAAALDLVTLTAGELGRSVAFYDAALGALGWRRAVELVDEEEEAPDTEAVGWGPPDEPARLWLVAGTPTMNAHVRLRAGSRAQVESFHAAAVAAGGISNAAPRRWPIYRTGEFNAIVADPDGNLLEAVSPE